jgi:hypothetical protein
MSERAVAVLRATGCVALIDQRCDKDNEEKSDRVLKGKR